MKSEFKGEFVMENRMKFKDFKKTNDYLTANVLEVYSAKTGVEFDDDFPESELEEMTVVDYSYCSGWLSVTLK